MFEIYDVVLIPLIIGLVQLLRTVGLNKKYLPLASLIFGLAGGIFYMYPEDLKGGIIVGLMLGLSASGLYSGTKNTLEKSSE
ncbi:hypothetical protein [Oceanobacillus chungangensis]|uniref:Holin n=1 Tax=Oceanobacillus chungangensis TaxID=1229152 RepID=A0A3D8PFX3_9BACI|nr:hypothetical protein [Oceanobacillus chungangensis]RDW14974.1 hypothetical protein CWR45_19100 [Oceanobacillus chungangensis]